MRTAALLLIAFVACTPGALARAADGPANTSPPTIPATVRVNGTVTADPGAWTSPNGSAISFAYQWLGCDSQGAACHLLPYGTRTVTHLQAPVGTTIRVTVTATDSTGSAMATSAPAKVLGAGTSPGPTPTPRPAAKAPTITLVAPKQGSILHTRSVTFVLRIRSTSKSLEINLNNDRQFRARPGTFRYTVRPNDPGTVRIRVEATNDNGNGATTGRSFSVTLRPPVTAVQEAGGALSAPGCFTCVVRDPAGDDLASPPDVKSISSTYSKGWIVFTLVTYGTVGPGQGAHPCLAGWAVKGQKTAGFATGCFDGPHTAKVFGRTCAHPDANGDCGSAHLSFPNSHTTVYRIRPVQLGNAPFIYWQAWVLYPGDQLKDVAPDAQVGSIAKVGSPEGPGCWVKQQIRPVTDDGLKWGRNRCSQKNVVVAR